MAEQTDLFPVEESPEFVDDEDTYDTEFKRSVAWDYELGDFVRDGNNNMVEANGQEAYETWCVKQAFTERYNELAYPDEIGTEMDAALKNESREAVESDLEDTLTEALMTNPRTDYVGNFEFTWDGEELECQFDVTDIDGNVITINI